MTDLDQLYQQMILEHNRNPRHFNEVTPHTHYSHGHNPLCGDDYIIQVRVKDNIIEDIGFTGDGCAISKSSGSLMTQSIIGKSIEDVILLKNKFITSITTNEQVEDLGKLIVFNGVKKFPVRVKCAALTWRALEDALENTSEEHHISTE